MGLQKHGFCNHCWHMYTVESAIGVGRVRGGWVRMRSHEQCLHVLPPFSPSGKGAWESTAGVHSAVHAMLRGRLLFFCCCQKNSP